MDFVKIVFAQMTSNAGICKREAGDINKLYNDLKSKADELEGGGFVGQTAKAWYNEINSNILPRLQKLEAALNETAQVIAFLNDKHEEADNQFAAIFKKLGVSG